jgi:hypothetical protein
MNIHEPLPHAAAVYVDFSRDHAQSNRDHKNGCANSVSIPILIPRLQEILIDSCNGTSSVLVPLQDFETNLDFNHRTGAVEIAVLDTLSISITKVDIVGKYLYCRNQRYCSPGEDTLLGALSGNLREMSPQ